MFEIQIAQQSRPLQVPNTPLVTPATPAVTENTAGDFIKAVRDGWITSNDIADRVGKLGQSQRAAEVQKNREIIDPKAIAARAVIRDAEVEKAKLAGAEAQAAMPLVAARADLAQGEMERKKAGLWLDAGLKAHEETGRPPVYFLNEDGTRSDEVDAEQTAALGAAAREAKEHITEAAKMLQGDLKTVFDPKLKQMVIRPLNALGQDVSPGSKDFVAWSKKLHDAYDDYYYPPSVKPRTRASSKTSASAGAAAPSKETETKRQAKEESAVNAGLVRPKDLLADVTGGEVFAGPPPDENFDVLKLAESRPTYQAWIEKITPMENFNTAARRIQAGPGPAEKGPLGLVEMRQLDDQLITAVRQMVVQSQSATARGAPEFQSKLIEEGVSLPEKLSDWKQTLASTGKFPPGTRERLIQLGNDYIRAREKGALPDIKWVAERTGNPRKYWTDDSAQMRLLRGESLAVADVPLGHYGAETAPAIPSGVKELPSGKRIVFPPAIPAKR